MVISCHVLANLWDIFLISHWSGRAQLIVVGLVALGCITEQTEQTIRSKPVRAFLHGFHTSSCLQDPALFECLPWLPSVWHGSESKINPFLFKLLLVMVYHHNGCLKENGSHRPIGSDSSKRYGIGCWRRVWLGSRLEVSDSQASLLLLSVNPDGELSYPPLAPYLLACCHDFCYDDRGISLYNCKLDPIKCFPL